MTGRDAVALMVLIIVMVQPAVAGIPVNSSTVISSPGDYFLDGDILNCNPTTPHICIEIESPDVTLEGMGHTIDGINTTNTDGILVVNTSYVPISHITIKNMSITNFSTAIKLYSVQDSVIGNVVLYNNTLTGISAMSSGNLTLYNTTERGNMAGMMVMLSDNTTFSNTLVSNNTLEGIMLEASRNTTFRHTAITNHTTGGSSGLFVGLSSDTLIEDSIVTNNDNGIFLLLSSNTTVRQAVLENNINATILLFMSENNTISDSTANAGMDGISLWGSVNNRIFGNTIAGNTRHGIFVTSNSTQNQIENNSVRSNNQMGIVVIDFSNSTAITTNVISDNQVNGIVVNNSDGITVTGNSVCNNLKEGIILDRSNNNTLSGNTITNNSITGLVVQSSGMNTIFNNYFENSNNTAINGMNFTNVWNITKTPGLNIIGGAWLGGNFWSDYAGYDYDDDGIGNTVLPYRPHGSPISGGDWLPLTNVTGPLPLPEAAFSVNRTIGPAPFSVSFTDLSTGSPVSWNWSFGDGGISMEQNPVHTYQFRGNYSVLLRTTNSSGYYAESPALALWVCPKGDFNRNWRVDIGDVTTVAYMAVTLIPADPAADFGGDGSVDVADAAAIAYYYIGKIAEL